MCIRDSSQVVEAKDDEEAYQITKDKLLEEKDLLGIFVSTAFGNIGVGKAVSYTHLDVYKRQALQRQALNNLAKQLVGE